MLLSLVLPKPWLRIKDLKNMSMKPSYPRPRDSFSDKIYDLI